MTVLDIPQTAQEWQGELQIITHRGRGLDWSCPTEKFFSSFNLSYGPMLEHWAHIDWYGPLEPYLRDPTLRVTDILINGPHQEMVIVAQGRRQQTGVKLHTSWIELLQRQLLLQSELVTPAQVDAWPALPNHPAPAYMVRGCVGRSIRFSMTRPPATPAGPTLALRILPTKWPYLADVVSSGMITREAADMLLESLRRGTSIIIAGMTGCGKTTLMAALLQHIGQEKRIVVIEEAAEMPDFVDSVHVEVLRSRATFSDCVVFAMRQKTDLVVVGETLAEEAGAMLQAMSTGHPGITTIHAANVQTALKNVERMACQAGNVPPSLVRQMIGNKSNPLLVVHIGRYGNRRTVGAIEEVRPIGPSSNSGDNYPVERIFALDESSNELARVGWIAGEWGTQNGVKI